MTQRIDPASVGFQALLNVLSDQSARINGIATLGELRALLEALPPETPVKIDDGSAPASLSSYRGYYERLGIGTHRYRDDYETELLDGGPGFDSSHFGFYQPGASSVKIAEPVTAAEMLKALNLADGQAFEGYKGGQYQMDSGTYLHVAEHGDCGRCVVGMELRDDSAVILTAEERF